MITLYHGSNTIISNIDLTQCNPYKDFGQAFYLTTDKEQALNVANARVDFFGGMPVINSFCFDEKFKFMTECITSDIIQLLMDREHYSLSEAVSIVYDSATYSALLRPETGLYSQSSGYVYAYLRKELDKHS